MSITPEQARAELARRELAKRGVSLDGTTSTNGGTTVEPTIYDTRQQMAEQNINQRGVESKNFETQIKEHPIKSLMQMSTQVPLGLEGIKQQFGTVNELWKRAEAIPANIGMSIQDRNVSTKNPLFANEIKQAVTGERLGSLGDVALRSGVPGVSNPIVAKTAGALGMGGLSELATTGKFIPQMIKKGLVGGLKQDLTDVKNIVKFATSKLPGVKAKGLETQLKGIQTNLGVDKSFQGDVLPTKTLPREIGGKIDKAKLEFQQLSNNVDNEMKVTAKNILEPQIKNKLPKLIHEGGTKYREILDKVSEDMIQKGNGITRSEIEGILNNVVNNHQDNFLPGSPSYSEVQKLISKYSSDDIKLPTDNISLQQFKQDVSEVYKKLSLTNRGGKGALPGDVSGKLLYHEWGNFIATKSPEFAKLQSDYTPVIQAMKASQSLFKPNADIYQKTDGAKYLVDYAIAKANNSTTLAQEQLMNFLEKGTDFTPGIGNVTQQLQALAKSKVDAGKKLADIVSHLSEQEANVQQLIAVKDALVKKQHMINASVGVGAGLTGISFIKSMIKKQLGGFGIGD